MILMTEEKLIKLSQSGNIKAFGKLIDLHQVMVYNTALHILGHVQDAEEATQDAFIRVHKYIGNFKSESKFTTWLYRIVRNCCLDKIRSRKETYSLDELTQNQLKADTVDIFSGNDELYLAVQNLPENYREIVVLHYYNELPYNDICDILNMSLSNVKIQMFRAKKLLKDILEKHAHKVTL